MDTSNFMFAMGFFTQAASSYFGAELQSQAFRAQARFRERISDMNREISENQAQDALIRGESATLKMRGQGRIIQGQQRVGYAAQGIDVDYGVAVDIQRETQDNIREDIFQIRNNAWREAWGYKMDAVSASMQGQLTSMASQSQANTTLLTGTNNALAYGLRGVGQLYNTGG